MIKLNYKKNSPIKIGKTSYTVESYIRKHRQFGVHDSTIKYKLGKLLHISHDEVKKLFEEVNTSYLHE